MKLDIKYNSCKKKKLKKIKNPHFYHLNTSNSLGKKIHNYNNNLVGTNLVRGKSFLETPMGNNFDLKKRIIEKNSVYSLSQWRKDFKRSRIYKKISCEFPSINFVAKPKRKISQNYAFSPTKDMNIFNGIRFKPFESFEEENSKGNNSFGKHKKRKRKFIFLHKHK